MKEKKFDVFDNIFSKRAIDIAQNGLGSVSPNPMVGGILASNYRILAEGWHQKYGQAHAEVNCLKSYHKNYDSPIPDDAQMYVTLVPCCIHGNTPACTDLLIREKIKSLHVGCDDATPGVESKSLVILKENSIETTLQNTKEAKLIARFRNVSQRLNRPYIIIKYARNHQGIYGDKNQQIAISNQISKRIVHQWRNECDAIVIGANTLLLDNPKLDNRFYYGKSPIRVVLDRKGRSFDKELNVYNDGNKTIIFTQKKEIPSNLLKNKNLQFITLSSDNFLQNAMAKLYELKLGIVLIEGGSTLQKQFFIEELYDEIREIVAHKNIVEGEKIEAPTLPTTAVLKHSEAYRNDTHNYWFSKYVNKMMG